MMKNHPIAPDNIFIPSVAECGVSTGEYILHSWTKDNNYHNDFDLPSYIFFYKNGSIGFVEYYKHGRSHRTTGPACETFLGPHHEHRAIFSQKPPRPGRYYIYGIELNKKYIVYLKELGYIQ